MNSSSVSTVTRHLAWFAVETGTWIGEWCGTVPAPVVPPSVSGDARLLRLNAWLQELQSYITPDGSPYEMESQAWDLQRWDACPVGGAVCVDVTTHGWPVGDFRWATFNVVDRRLTFSESHLYLQVSTDTLQLDVNHTSGRPVQTTDTKLVADVTDTAFAPWHGQLFGRFVSKGGRLVFLPRDPGRFPEIVSHAVTDQHPALAVLASLDQARLALESAHR